MNAGRRRLPSFARVSRVAVLFALLPLASGCAQVARPASPLRAAEVSWNGADGRVVRRGLSAEQVVALQNWLAQSIGGWRRCFETPSPLHAWTVSLQYADGSTGFLELLKYRDEAAPGTLEAGHLSGGALADQPPCTLQNFGPNQLEALATILPRP
jgi:hypothetical protein